MRFGKATSIRPLSCCKRPVEIRIIPVHRDRANPLRIGSVVHSRATCDGTTSALSGRYYAFQLTGESMLAARILGNAIDRDDARWLSESPTIREKLERLNLISSGKIAVDRKSMTMEEFLDDYIERQGKSRKPATVAVWKQVVANLKEFMPAGIKINQITAGHAKEFHEELKARGMATTTIHKRIQFARQFMHDAVDWKIIEENPFLKVKTQKRVR